MNKSRSYLLGLWIVANAVVLSLLILDPTHLVEECEVNPFLEDGTVTCVDVTRPFIVEKYLIAGAVLGNGVALGAWVALRARREPRMPDSN